MGKNLGPVSSQELQIPSQQTKHFQEGGVNVVLTAFDPYMFGNVRDTVSTKTACWESVRHIPGRGVNFHRPVNVFCYRLRNIYDFISKQIVRCWEKHSPDLVIIVGQHISSDFNELVLEQGATSTHVLRDQLNLLARSDCCTNNGPLRLETGVNLQDVVDKLREANNGFSGSVADTPSGYYLCDYAYYNSLYRNPAKTVCIRVPERQTIPGEDVADAISLCITFILEQLHERRLLSQP